MTDEIKEKVNAENKKDIKPQEIMLRIMSEACGKYIIIDDKTIYEFIFPMTSDFAKNLKIVNFIATQLIDGINNPPPKEEVKATDPQKEETKK